MYKATAAVGTLTVVFVASQLLPGSGQSGSPFSSLTADRAILVNFGQYGDVHGDASDIDTTANNVSVRAKIKKISEPWILATVGDTDVWINLDQANWVRILD